MHVLLKYVSEMSHWCNANPNMHFFYFKKLYLNNIDETHWNSSITLSIFHNSVRTLLQHTKSSKSQNKHFVWRHEIKGCVFGRRIKNWTLIYEFISLIILHLLHIHGPPGHLARMTALVSLQGQITITVCTDEQAVSVLFTAVGISIYGVFMQTKGWKLSANTRFNDLDHNLWFGDIIK